MAALTRLDVIVLTPRDAGPGSRGPAGGPRVAGPAAAAGAARGVRAGRARVPVPPAREVLDAGFTHRRGSGGTGFAAGGALDQMPACARLAASADRARARGLGSLSDDELAGLLAAQRRLASRATAGELAVIGELAGRRAARDGSPGEHVEDEVAAVLTLTSRAAADRVALAAAMTRLPAVAGALAAGRIDTGKAGVFAGELIAVDDDLAAAAIAAVLVPAAAGMTTGELRRDLRWQIAAFDPQAAARRKHKAQKDARVEFWTEPAGTGAIAGRDLNLAAAIAADQSLDTSARWLAARGTPGTLDQLRAQVFLARLSGQPLHTLLPQPPAPGSAGPDAAHDAAGTAAAGSGAADGTPDAAGAAGGTAGADAGTAGGSGTGPAGAAGNKPSGGAGSRPAPAAPPAGTGAGPAGPGGSVNLTIPLATWLGQSDTPADAGRYGTIDAATSRDLTTTLATTGRARWCITLVDPRGRAVAHGCARAGPGPPGTDRASWLASVTITPIESGTCAHRRESAGYRQSGSLRHIVKIRSPQCGYPGCRRPAQRCDDDHTIPHHQGGKTCECNLYPLCRRHHRAKQAEGWHLAQPEPGILTWTLPCGRTITTVPAPYPV